MCYCNGILRYFTIRQEQAEQLIQDTGSGGSPIAEPYVCRNFPVFLSFLERSEFGISGLNWGLSYFPFYFPVGLRSVWSLKLTEEMASRRDLEAGRPGERARLLGNDSDDDMIGVPRGSARTTAPDDKVAGVQQQVQGVMGVMQDNINRILERGERLDDLEERSDNLNVNADHFRRGATQVRRRMWWQNCRMRIIILIVILIIIGIIVAVVVTQVKPKNASAVT
ncbi:vesicle-associated membrane protein 4-like isoform X1 [Paramacrobiotus metropolitanus]|uniref:vesicle-associated membrane protein 4-like isoform X1 n=1 Tax=Paramacrobiotus metropolitanus TaxID=2943436 RepID=UPI00244596FC|nr:vesicle-associated membrane protein 4-like isoform X1 [Paramacrobiotus metropolitanus]